MVDYIAGPRWLGKERPGDPVFIPADTPKRRMETLFRMQRIEVKPKGQWVYVAGDKYRGAERPGQRVDVSGFDRRMLRTLVERGTLKRIDSGATAVAKKGRKGKR